MVEHLLADELIELRRGTVAAGLAGELADFLSAASDTDVDISGAAIAEWLEEHDGVEEIFASDTELEAARRRFWDAAEALGPEPEAGASSDTDALARLRSLELLMKRGELSDDDEAESDWDPSSADDDDLPLGEDDDPRLEQGAEHDSDHGHLPEDDEQDLEEDDL